MDMRKIEDQDFQWAFGLNRLSLNFIGIWPSENLLLKDRRIPFMLFWMFIGLLLPELYALTKVCRVLPLLTDNIMTSCTIITSSMKLFLLWFNRHALGQLITMVKEDWTGVTSACNYRIMMKQAGRARLFTLSGYCIMLGSFVGFIMLPILGMSIRIINNITDPDPDRFFPLQVYYPFDTTKTPIFELLFLKQFTAGVFVATSFSVPDNFFGMLAFHASAQCEILAAKVRACDYERVQREFGSLVKEHMRLIRFVNKLEESFNVLILMQVACLSIIICCLGYGVARAFVEKESETSSVVQIVTLGGTVLNVMIHMLVYCIASEILAEQSLHFSYAIYCLEWHRLPAKCTRDILTVMIRSKFPLHLTAGKFIILSLNAYMRILKTSFGYISVLLTVSY